MERKISFMKGSFSFSTYYLLEGRLPWTPVASLFASLPVLLFDSWIGHEYQSVPVARERTPKYCPHGIALDIARTRTLFILLYTRHCVLCNISFPGLFSHGGKDHGDDSLREKWRDGSFSNEKLDRDSTCFWCRYHVVRRVTKSLSFSRVTLHTKKKALHVMRSRWPAHGIPPHAPAQRRRLDFKTIFLLFRAS